MRNQARAPKFDQYSGEDKFIFGGVVYERRGFLGRGATASVYHFCPIGSLISAQPVAVKVELPVIYRGVNQFEEGCSFAIEAYWNKEIYGLGVLSGDPRNTKKEHYLLMPYFAGVLACDVSLNGARDLVEWFIMVACFIHQKMHLEKKAIHGDIKLDNVIFHAAEKKASVIDFGLTEKMGRKIGRYSIPESKNLKAGSIKLSPAQYCPQTPPELFGNEMIPAEPSQDAYGLGHFIFSLLCRASDISREQVTKLCFVIAHLRETHPQDRWSIPAAISKLHADFIAVVPHAITSAVELKSSKVMLYHQRRTEMNQSVSNNIAPGGLIPEPLTKVMADSQLGFARHQVVSFDERKNDPAVRLESVPAESSSVKSGDAQDQQERPGSIQGSEGVGAPGANLFSLLVTPKQHDVCEKPAQDPICDL